MSRKQAETRYQRDWEQGENMERNIKKRECG